MLVITRLLVFLTLVLISGACRSDEVMRDEAMTASGCPDSFIEANDWVAVDNQEPAGRQFYVTGEVVVSTEGYSVTLKKRIPQGTNPAILVLDLTVTKPTGVVPQVITTEEPRYEEASYSGSYKSVEIYCGASQVAAPSIRVVH